MSVHMSNEQFQELLRTISTNKEQSPPVTMTTGGSFSKCTARFDGKRCPTTVNTFVTTVNIYKDVEKISDEDALKGLPLLLTDSASVWWQGVKGEARTWNEATTLIRAAFSPSKPAYQTYLEIFTERQDKNASIDDFICRKRALFAQLPENRHDENTQLDMVFGLLHISTRKEICRDNVKSFADLLQRGREVEMVNREAGIDNKPKPDQGRPAAHNAGKTRVRCNFCHYRGHTMDECRKRVNKDAEAKDKTQNSSECSKDVITPPRSVTCYGCGKPGYFRSNCPVCADKKPDVATQAINFYSVNTLTNVSTQVPTIPVTVSGITGVAHIDTAAKTSVAGRHLYECLRRVPTVIFLKQQATVTLADGLSHMQDILTTTVNIQIQKRSFEIDFVVLPDAEDNRTLLGIDFLEKAAMVLVIPQRSWYFADMPHRIYEFTPLSQGRTPELVRTSRDPVKGITKTASRQDRKEEEFTDLCSTEISRSPFLDLYSSPLPDETYHLHEVDTFDTIQHPFEGNNNYSPGAINRIFQDAVPIYSYNLPDQDPRKRRRLDFCSIDISLQPTEATDLTEQQKKDLNLVLLQYKDRFDEDGPPTTFAEHHIDTGDHIPISCAPYRISTSRQTALREKIDEMLATGIIEESNTPWTSPVVLVPKKDNDVRVCIDYRRLNAITVPDRYPLPRIDDLLHAAKGLPFMTCLDLQSGYWQIVVNEKDKDKTGFITPFGVYRFNRMPFGLRNAPSTFQRLMDRFKVSLSNVNILVYLDDIIVRSPTFENHLKDLQSVFAQLRNFNLRANRKKCRFSCSEIRYLGHLITKDGIVMDPDKIIAIAALPPPANVKQLLSFIQTCSWYRRFIENFAALARPLTNLTKASAIWKWNAEEQNAFDELKRRLTESPVLKQADETQPYTIKTDASAYAIGAVLIQGEREDEHPIEYASRLLSSAERNYNTTEREALAIVWSVTKFRGYIEGSHAITVITDHQPLKWLLSLKTPTGRLARWALQLQSFNLHVQYAPGRTNRIADFLSRPPCQDHAEDCQICNIQIDLPSKTEKDIRIKQISDPELKLIIEALEEISNEEVNQKWINRGYFLHKGVLYRHTDDQEDDEARLVVPSEEIKEILYAYHDSPTAGHYGIDKTTHQIAKRYYWTKMRQDIAKHISACLECQRYKISNRKPAGLMQTHVLNQRFEVLAIDLFGPLPTSTDGQRWILIIEDTASRWTELFALTEATAENCAQILLNEIFLRYGLARHILSDNGTQFISAVMQKLTYCLGIQQTFIPLYHAETNIVERKNRDLKTQLGILVGNKHNTWPDHLPAIRFAMNSAICDSTKHTAAYLTFGRELRTPQDVRDDLSTIIENENFVPEITPKLQQLAYSLQLAKEINEIKQDRQQARQNCQRRPDPKYSPGDHVWIHSHFLSNAAKGFSSKLAPRRDGPYVVLRQRGPASYEIADVKSPNQPLGVYHSSDMTPYIGNNDMPPEPVTRIRKRGRPRKVTILETATNPDTTQVESAQSSTSEQLPKTTSYSPRRLRNQRGRL